MIDEQDDQGGDDYEEYKRRKKQAALDARRAERRDQGSGPPLAAQQAPDPVSEALSERARRFRDTRPDPVPETNPTVGALGDMARTAGGVAKSFLLDPILHPYDTAKGLVSSAAKAPVTLGEYVAEKLPMFGGASTDNNVGAFGLHVDRPTGSDAALAGLDLATLTVPALEGASSIPGRLAERAAAGDAQAARVAAAQARAEPYRAAKQGFQFGEQMDRGRPLALPAASAIDAGPIGSTGGIPSVEPDFSAFSRRADADRAAGVRMTPETDPSRMIPERTGPQPAETGFMHGPPIPVPQQPVPTSTELHGPGIPAPGVREPQSRFDRLLEASNYRGENAFSSSFDTAQPADLDAHAAQRTRLPVTYEPERPPETRLLPRRRPESPDVREARLEREGIERANASDAEAQAAREAEDARDAARPHDAARVNNRMRATLSDVKTSALASELERLQGAHSDLQPRLGNFVTEERADRYADTEAGSRSTGNGLTNGEARLEQAHEAPEVLASKTAKMKEERLQRQLQSVQDELHARGRLDEINEEIQRRRRLENAKKRAGATNTTALSTIAGAGGGAAIGAASDQQDPGRGALLGGLAGAGLGYAAERGLSAAARSFSDARMADTRRTELSTPQGTVDRMNRLAGGNETPAFSHIAINGVPHIMDANGGIRPMVARTAESVTRGNRVGAVGDWRSRRSLPGASQELSLFKGDQNDLFGSAESMQESEVGRRAPKAPESAPVPEQPAAITADEMAARRDELGAPKSAAEGTATADQGELGGKLTLGQRHEIAKQLAAGKNWLGETEKPSEYMILGDEALLNAAKQRGIKVSLSEKTPKISDSAEPSGAPKPPAQGNSGGTQGTLFSTGGLGPALSTRLGGSALIGTAGAALHSVGAEKGNEGLEYTGNGLMLMAALHAVGMPRIKEAGSFAGGKIVDALKGSETGERALNFISRDILTDPRVKSVVGAYDLAAAKGRARAAELAKAAKTLGPERDRAVSDIIERESFQPLTPHDAVAIGVAQRISDEFTDIGRGKVKAGLLSSETVAKREGSYLPRMYAEQLGDKAGATPPRAGASQSRKIRIQGDRRRLDLPDDVRNQLGEVREASFRTAQGVDKGYRDIAAAHLFDALKEMPGVIHPDFAEASTAYRAARASGDKTAISAAHDAMSAVTAKLEREGGGYTKLADTRGLGVLRGAIVRNDVAAYLNGVPQFGGLAGNLLTTWKKIHTVMNLGTHVGNVMSNIAVAHMTGVPLWEQPKAMRAALKDYRAYGPATKYLAERGVLEKGLPTATEATPVGGKPLRQSLRELAATTRPETRNVLELKGITPKSKLRVAAERMANRAASVGLTGDMEHAYAAEDGAFRVMTWQRLTRDGMKPEKAADIVDHAFVNYTTRSPALNMIRNTVSPFVMYPAKAIPYVTSQIVEHPVRWATLAGIWGGMDQYSQKKVGKLAEADKRPSQRMSKALGYLEPGLTQLPFTSATGDKYATDVARWTPFSALTGAPAPGSATYAAFGENVPGLLQPSGPLLDMGARLSNTDPFTGKKLIRPGDDANDMAAQVVKGAASLALPSAASFHAPRVVSDLRNADPAAAAVDALGFIGARPQVVQPGLQQEFEQNRYEEARKNILFDMRVDLRKSKSPARSADIQRHASEKLEALAKEFQSSRPLPPESAPADDYEAFKRRKAGGSK